jgi:hypothetical protein
MIGEETSAEVPEAHRDHHLDPELAGGRLMLDRKSRFLFLTWVFVSCLILAPQAASAQTVTGTLQGTVTDTKGAVVPGVKAASTIEKIDVARELGADGIILFSYDFTIRPGEFNPASNYLQLVQRSAFVKAAKAN